MPARDSQFYAIPQFSALPRTAFGAKSFELLK